ncbi:hypothetical protein M9Y10_035560 [Tritrichomonas musculus]|uniref:WYL domain-containing protein n=1 Tax=Tritrichomonas musculus TaxID=1915356 RepID=A0ABR2GW46_9EUKA
MSLIYITNGKDLATVINRYIRRLNKELNANISTLLRDTQSMRRTRLNRYLIDNNFLDFEGSTINDDTIGDFINRMKHDDSYLKGFKYSIKPNSVDKYDSFMRTHLSKRFTEQHDSSSDDEQKQKEKQINDNIKIAHDALNNALQLIKSQNLLLKPLPPKTNKQPKRYIDERFNIENHELIEYLDKFGFKGFHSNHDEYLCVNEPHDFDKAINKLIYFDKYDDESIKERTDKDNKKPIITYYFNKLKSLDDVYKGLEKIFKTEIKPFKINTQMTGVFETPKADDYEYEAREIKWWNYKGETPIIVRLPEDIDKVKLYIESKLHEYQTSTVVYRESLEESEARTTDLI